jgi:hypothetical protein
MNKFRKSVKATIISLLVIVAVFGIFWILEYYTKESLIVLLVAFSGIAIYSLWKFIYNEIE